MFARLFAVASLAALAVAGPAPIAIRGECSTGTIQCCQNVYPASHVSQSMSQFGLASIFAGLEDTLAGSGCSPLSVVGVGSSGSRCTQEPVCCNDNTFNGLLAIGCSPINLNL